MKLIMFFISFVSVCNYFCNTSLGKEEKFYAFIELYTCQEDGFVPPNRVIPITKPTEIYPIGKINSGVEIGISIILDIEKKFVTQKISLYKRLDGEWILHTTKDNTYKGEYMFRQVPEFIRFNDVSISYRIYQE